MSREGTATERKTTLWATYNNEGKESVSFFISNNSYTDIILKIGTELQQFSIIDQTEPLRFNKRIRNFLMTINCCTLHRFRQRSDDIKWSQPIPVAARSKVWVCGRLACWDCGFESHRGHGYLSVVSVVCCQVEVSASGWSLVQRSPNVCGAS